MAELRDKPHRRYELDWLRVLIIINLIPFHVVYMIAFVPGFSHIPKDTLSTSVLVCYVFFFLWWMMPLLFLISGMSSFYALDFRSARAYVQERLKRLLVPLVFFMLVGYPLVVYFFPIVEGEKSLSHYLFHFWPYCLKTIHRSPVRWTTLYNHFQGAGPRFAHLWFLAYLLIFSLIALPLFLYLRKQVGHELTSKLATFFNKKGAIFLLGVPFVVIIATLTVRWPLFQNNLYTDWAFFCYNLTAFVFGFLICLDERFWQAIDGHFRISLLCGVVCFLLVLAMRLGMPTFSTPAYSPRYMLYATLFGFNTWFWILTMLGLARRFLSGTNSFLKYFSQASYPFYIIHLVPMPIIGYYVVRWRTGVLPEFLILTILSFVATLGSYELIVKRTKVTRFLFGMKA